MSLNSLFQFQYGTIKTANQEATWHNQFHFNSIFGTIKTRSEINLLYQSVISIPFLVQLKLPCPSSTSTAILFQFHNGTIKTHHKKPSSSYFLSFQFHNGTIKTSIQQYSPKQPIDFNSIMVQLKQRLYLRLSQSHHVFQFHASTIKTICTLDVSLRLLNFNSIMVQLKRESSVAS